MQRLWERRTLDLQGCAMGGSSSSACGPTWATRTSPPAAGHAWSALSRACHHHPHELAATAAELRGWLFVVEEVIRKADRS